MKVTWVATAATALAMLSLAPGGGALAAPTNTHHAVPSICHKAFNPLTKSQALLRSCGDRVMPLRRVTSLPGGGKAYDYGDYTQVVPPANFRVLKASDKQLSEFGFPTRKRLGRRWYKIMHKVRVSAQPPSFLVSVPNAIANSDSSNWAGYVVSGHSYTEVDGLWNEAHFSGNGCSKDMFVQWVGIGGWNSNYLGQDGTSFNVPGVAAHQPWIEAINGVNDPGRGIVPVNLTNGPNNANPGAGDIIYADVTWDPANSVYHYYISDNSTGGFYIGHSRTVTADQSHVEAISERPQIGVDSHNNPIYSPLSDFGSGGFASPTGFWGSGSSNDFYHLPHNSITMTGDGGEKLATVGALGSTSANFGNFDTNYVATNGDCQ